MAEITKHGAAGTTLSEYLDTMRQKYLDIDSGWYIDPESPDGLAIAAWCETLANLDEGVIGAYHASDPNAAVGRGLENIAAFAGVRRRAASFSTTTVQFGGDGLIEVPAGTLIRHRIDDTLWMTDNAVVTSSAGVVTVSVTCIAPGAQSANIGTLTRVATPVPGIRTVTNLEAASLGLDEEKDNAFRVRRNESVALPGNNQIDNIYAALVNVDGVKQAKIFENVESEPDEHGIYGHSMALFVDGGITENIASTIAAHKNPGCGLNRYNTIPNKVTLNTFTPRGQPFTATFFRPDYVSIFVRVEISTSTLTDDDKPKIKEAIVDYTLLGFDETAGFAKLGFRIGERLAAGRLYTPVNYFVAGHDYVSNILIGTEAGSVDKGVIAVAFNQLGVFDVGNIEVIYV
ncbi:baseplate J/gp47 family protein [Serratia fonticola]|uniref:Baseplate J/gp47 family protein n=1 Tax=Serratia fonticola TaxID=47917 RepID=A0AAW3WU11_SERFO|nr:baseplate J/gp47 family protein [Serratia fonticola]MBC3214224.1 baseplate J/gp47 family protein [Serratia fonticola]NYA13614.1 baseplate J/gp47 family protein [Serratia fonticola]NYA35075.1 baseplate J/gp47 family protein [Serratia fonticola]